MTDWPKKMWMDASGFVSIYIGMNESIPVLVYPADQAPDFEAAIRASERDRCAKVCEMIDRSDTSDGATALACAAAIRWMSDEHSR